MRRNRLSRKTRTVKITLLLSAILLTFLCTVIVLAILIEDLTIYNYDTSQYIANVQTETVIGIKTRLDEELSEDLIGITNEIRKEILALPDPVKIECGNLSPEVEDILRNNIQNVYLNGIEDCDNNIFVCNRNGILYDQDIVYSAIETRTWDFDKSRLYNKEMAEKTINNLVNQNITSSEYLVIERYKSTNPHHVYYDTLNSNIIKEIILAEGLQGLQSYTFLLPVYIEQNGDIYGNPDMVSGKLQKNSKIIVVQEYNLYDYIVKNHIMDQHTRTGILLNDYSRITLLIKIFSIILIVSVITITIFSVMFTNETYDIEICKKTMYKS